ncbi:MAG: hypothetical protein GX163_00130 [Bacteroidetes bacterium]|nr:hypothetical protein [Bacteroidota bacterium]
MGRNFKTKIIFVLVFLCCLPTFSQSIKPLTYKEIKTGIASYLVEIGFFKGIEEYHTDTNTIRFSGFFNEIADKNAIPDGVYCSSTRASHGIYLFVIVDGNEYKILNLYDKQDLFSSLTEILNFSIKKDYCKELVIEYIERALNWHSLMQSYRRSNCYFSFDNKQTLSNVSLGELKNKLVNYLKSENIIGDESFHILLLDKIDEFNVTINLNPLNEDDASKKLDKGYYRFTATDNMEYAISYYLLLKDTNFELVTTRGNNNLNQELLLLLNFGIEQKFCFEKVKYILLNYLEEGLPLESCLSDLKKRLP